MKDRTYIAIDLKSFYASVECVDRGLDPLDTNLVVADISRTEKTICLAVTPPLKARGISGRPRLFEVIQKVREINTSRLAMASGHRFRGKSFTDTELRKDPSLELDYIVARPRMSLYVHTSAEIYSIYLKYISPQDIHVYSVDEVFIDATSYLKLYKLTAREFTMKLILEVLAATGITATAGIGTNLYLCKIAMDIVAKHTAPDKDGVRIAVLDEMSYRQRLWGHRPLTDFWRIGRGYSKKLEDNLMFTMGDVARCSIYNEDRLYRLFGINAELLIDHAWGWEPCTIDDIKSYRPALRSVSSGQVLSRPYSFDEAEVIVREMGEALSLDLAGHRLATDKLVLHIGYDYTNVSAGGAYTGETRKDYMGRTVPRHAHGTESLRSHTCSTSIITEAFLRLFHRIAAIELTIRRISVAACSVIPLSAVRRSDEPVQISLFSDFEEAERIRINSEKKQAREQREQEAIIRIKTKYGKNAIFKGISMTDCATMMERNRQIGGHKA